jgi:hypothetical protein
LLVHKNVPAGMSLYSAPTRIAVADTVNAPDDSTASPRITGTAPRVPHGVVARRHRPQQTNLPDLSPNTRFDTLRS